VLARLEDTPQLPGRPTAKAPLPWPRIIGYLSAAAALLLAAVLTSALVHLVALELPTLPGLLPEDLGRYYGSYQFPNLMLNLHPDCVMYYLGYPKGPSHTTVVSEYLFPPEVIADPDRFKPQPVVELWDLISKQDWDVCERAQTGVGSRAFTTGVYPRQDRFLYSFNEDYRVRMGRQPLG